MSLAGMHKTALRQAWFFTRQVGRGRSSQSHERERRRVRHFRPRRDGDGARIGVAQDREVGVAEEHLSRRRRRRRDARGPPAERARVRGRARRRRPLEISEPRRRRLGVAGDDAVRRVDDARARRGPPAAAEGRVGERRVEVAVVAPPAFFFICGRASPARANFWLGSVNAYRRQRALESGMFAERPRVARRHFFHAETTSNPSCRRSAAGAAVVAGCPSDHLQDPRAPPRPRLPKNVRVLLDIAGRAKL